MSKKIRWLLLGSLVVIAAAALVLAKTVFADGGLLGNATDPQMLMIPRWFLSSMTVQGQEVQLPADKHLTLQFAEGNQVNGEGGCNSFGGSYSAGKDGGLTISNLLSTMMACEGAMDQESAYFNALSQVKTYHFDQGKLVLASADGQTTLIFVKPPK